MKRVLSITAIAALVVVGAMYAVAVEEAEYDVVEEDGAFELRDYAGHILAETVVSGSLEEAGNRAFEKLFGYISGGNRSREEVAMTAPVSQQPAGEAIAMTAPVGQKRVGENWAVSFMMPGSYTLDALPKPTDSSVTLRQVPPRRMAAVRYSGSWSEEGYRRHREELEAWIHDMGYTAVGDPVWARYNAPYTPWFLRRNEVLIPVDAGPGKHETP